MPRTVTVTFEDGSKHIYQGVPDDASPQSVISRAQTDFRKTVSAVDGGRPAAAAAAAPRAASPTQTMSPAAARAYLESGGAVTPRNFMADVTALGAGVGQGFGNIALTGQKLLGAGLNRVGLNAMGQPLISDAETGIARLAAEVAPYKAAHPNIVTAGNIGASLPVGGLAGKAVGRAAGAVGLGARAAPVVTALETGGFKTGMLPARIAVAGGQAAAPTLATRAADIALRTGAGAATGAAGAAAVNPEDVGTGAIFGALIPTAGAKAARVVGNTLADAIDFARGRGGLNRAAELFRQTLGVDLDQAVNILKNAPEGITARQALQEAGVDADAFMALGENIEKGIGGPEFGRIAAQQDAARLGVLAKAAGGESTTAARSAAEEARFNLNAQTQAEREEALRAANLGGETIPPLQAEAAAARDLAAQRTQDVRQLAPLAERLANDRQVLGGISPLAQPEVTQEALNRVAAQAGRVDQAATRAAEESLAAGQTARTAEQKIADLTAAGIKPLSIQPVLTRLSTLANAPGERANLVRREAFLSLSDQLRRLSAQNGGILDARDLYEVRKSAINDTVSALLGRQNVTGKAARERTASLLREINPLIDQAIEDAGGVGWRDYLNTYSAGAKEIARQRLAARAAEMYRTSPDAYLKLMQGNKPKEVEKIFGPGSYVLIQEMASGGEGAVGASRLPALRQIQAELERDIGVSEAATRGKERAAQIVQRSGSVPERLFRSLARLGAPKVNYAADLAQSLIEQHISPQVQKALVAGFRDGKSAAELIQQVPLKDRAAAARALSNPGYWGKKAQAPPPEYRRAVTAGAAATMTRPPANSMATEPDNVNAMTSYGYGY
jgi:hypothetical protein